MNFLNIVRSDAVSLPQPEPEENFTTSTYNKDGEYNWGYDPLNYNMPEGSYSSDPNDGTKQIEYHAARAVLAAASRVRVDYLRRLAADGNGIRVVIAVEVAVDRVRQLPCLRREQVEAVFEREV